MPRLHAPPQGRNVSEPHPRPLSCFGRRSLSSFLSARSLPHASRALAVTAAFSDPPSLKCLLCLSLCVAGTFLRRRLRQKPLVCGLGNGLDTSSLASARLVSALPALNLSLFITSCHPSSSSSLPMTRAIADFCMLCAFHMHRRPVCQRYGGRAAYEERGRLLVAMVASPVCGLHLGSRAARQDARAARALAGRRPGVGQGPRAACARRRRVARAASVSVPSSICTHL